MVRTRGWRWATLVAWGLLAACGGEAPEPPAEVKATPTPPKVKPTELRVATDRMGPITAETPPTIEGVDAALSSFFKVQPAIGGLPGAKVAVVFDGEIVAQVTPDTSGSRIKHVYTNSSFVTFPWDTKVDSTIGKQKHWDRMACSLGEAPFDGRALCKAYEKGRIAYLVDVGESLPSKDAIAKKKITGMLWTPTH